MKKADERKLRKAIETEIGANKKSTDKILIDELIDWIKIEDQAKFDLAKSVEDNGRMDWQSLTTISMSSKNIIAITKALNLHHDKKLERVDSSTKKTTVADLSAFLNQN